MRHPKLRYLKFTFWNGDVEYYRVSSDGSYEFYSNNQRIWYKGHEGLWENKLKVELGTKFNNKVEEITSLEILVVLGHKAVGV